MRRSGPLLIALALLGALIVPALIGGQSVLPALLQIPLGDYVAIIACAMLGWVFRAAKLALLMRRLGVRAGAARVGAISLATEFAFLATPGGIGGYAAGVYYARGVGASFACASSITAADQLLDLLFFALALPLAVLGLAEAPLPSGLRAVALISSSLLGGVMLVLTLAHRPLGRWLFAPHGPLTRLPIVRRHAATLREFFATCALRLRELVRSGPRVMLALGACTIAQWLIRYGLLWLILWRLGTPLPFALLLLLQGLVLHATAWTGVPSGGGSADLALAATLAPLLPASNVATALLLWRFATLHLPLAAGFVALLLLREGKRAVPLSAPSG
jgi:uncharacterized protein (TIRG00374 family)